MEQIGREKRHILESRVEASREDQEEVQEEFKTTFELFKEVTDYDGGDLERFYTRMEAQLERSESKAEDVRERIRSIERVAKDLFDEWTGEIAEISRADLRRESESQLRATRSRYDKMIAAMKRAEAKMDPVLTAFRDQVLFLKHNLNASAIASLERSTADIESDVAALLREMQASIAETEVFLATL
jgi:pyruvate-formate lyase